MDPWRDTILRLERWHSAQDRPALDLAAHFLAQEMPGLLSPRLARTLGDATVRDLVQQFVLDLCKRPLPSTPEHPRTYLGRALQNRALSHLRRKQAEPMAIVPEPPPEHLAPAAERRAEARQALRVIQTLSMEDRVALKLSDAPEALDLDELDWLAARAGVPHDEVRALAFRAETAGDRVRLFDPGSSADDFDAGRAVDRFHQRVSRVRKRLRALWEGAR